MPLVLVISNFNHILIYIPPYRHKFRLTDIGQHVLLTYMLLNIQLPN